MRTNHHLKTKRLWRDSQEKKAVFPVRKQNNDLYSAKAYESRNNNLNRGAIDQPQYHSLTISFKANKIMSMKNNCSNTFRKGTFLLFTALNLVFSGGQSFAQCTTPAAITGSHVLCPPSFTTTLSDATSGGTWSTSDSGPVTVDPVSGLVTGISSGVTTITYTVAGGCFVTFSITNPVIDGPSTLCYSGPGSAITLSSAVGGGSWSSSSTIATVTPSGGVRAGTGFTGSIGTATISYSLLALCPGSYATKVITVDPVPTITSFDLASPLTSPLCELNQIGFTTTITGSASPYTYNWWYLGPHSAFTFGTNVDPSTTSSFWQLGGVTMAEAGQYVADVVDNLGCQSAMSSPKLVNVNPAPMVYNVTPTTGITPGDPLYLSGSQSGFYYQLVSDVVGPLGSYLVGTGSAISPFYTDLNPVASYYIIATDPSTGCFNMMDPIVYVCPTCRVVNPSGIGSAQGAGALALVPNPNTGDFTIAGTADFMHDAKAVKIEITNISGQIILNQYEPVTNGAINHSVQLAGNIANGIYQVKLSTTAGSQILRFMLNR